MEERKYFEIRDRATFIPAMALKLKVKTDKERYLVAMAGYGTRTEEQEEYVLLVKLDGLKISSDAYKWKVSRTMTVAHKYIAENYDELTSGQVIDVEYILKEVEEPKPSQYQLQ